MQPATPPHEPKDDLQLIEDAPPTTVPPAQESAAAVAVRQETQQLENERLRAVIGELVSNIKQRKKYAIALFGVMVGWLFFVAYVILAQGFGRGLGNYGYFKLSDAVVIALITTTTATVIGVYLVVANYLFHKRISPSN